MSSRGNHLLNTQLGASSTWEEILLWFLLLPGLSHEDCL